MHQRVNDGPENRVVIKIGTSSLITAGKVDPAKVGALCDAVTAGIDAGLSPILVTSGAIALGRSRHHALAEETPPAQQTAAALGQGLLYSALQSHFAERGLETGQILLTPHDLVEPERGGGVLQTFDLMGKLGLVPVVNENDALGVRNNDVLAALLSSFVGARLLLLLTNVAGLFDGNPLTEGDAVRITEVTGPIPEVEALAGGSSGDGGTGGMVVKLCACWIATHAGIRTVIADAMDSSVLLAAVRGEELEGTVFPARARRGEAPELGALWRAFRTPAHGSVVCDQDGLLALEAGKALLGQDVVAVEGDFDAGEVVDIVGPDGRLAARGSIRCSAADARSGGQADFALYTTSDYVRILEGARVGH